ncbi:hypothetical protein, partial [Mesorhizobium sp.]|uniref:hypothetical protein n=1 Tax=Mesorhizobium sp. TaxID=1871066 RepID=UPI003F8F36CC
GLRRSRHRHDRRRRRLGSDRRRPSGRRSRYHQPSARPFVSRLRRPDPQRPPRAGRLHCHLAGIAGRGRHCAHCPADIDCRRHQGRHRRFARRTGRLDAERQG